MVREELSCSKGRDTSNFCLPGRIKERAGSHYNKKGVRIFFWTWPELIAIVLAITAVQMSPASAAHAAALVATVGEPAPAFVLEDLGGAPLSAKALRGKPLYINVFASWCPPCRAELPEIVRSYARFRGRVTFLGVDEQEPAGRIASFARTMGIRYPIAIDQGQMEASYRAHSVPTSVFIDRRGVVRALYRGRIPAVLLQRYLARIAAS